MASDPEYLFGPFRLMPQRRRLLRDGQPVRLGARAFDLLCVLVAHAGELRSHAQLLAQVWGHTVVDDGSIRVHVAALRRALGDDPAHPRYIANVPQCGYGFVAPVVMAAAEAPLAHPPPPGGTVLPVSPPAAGAVAAPMPLIGRDEIVEAISLQLQSQRLVTLVGPGGIGKTAVALAVAARVGPQCMGGAVFVDLAPLSDPLQVPDALATALATHRQAPRTLVVLDNCEHLIDAAAGEAEALLGCCGGWRVLATSREPLRAQGEWIHRLRGLGTPWGDRVWTAQEALAYPAVQLLVGRIAASVDHFTLGDDEVTAAVRVCRAMDGIPLAIELAATHVPSFGLHRLATLLDERLGQLTHGRRTALARHRTLRATLDWSHGLLDRREQAVLRRLAVFRAAFTLQDALALALCPQINEVVAADGLASLVNKSLVLFEAGQGGEAPAYRLLQTTRGYALQRLLDSGEQPALARRHAERVLATLSETTGSRLGLEDLRGALDWAFSPGGDAALGTALTAASARPRSGRRPP